MNKIAIYNELLRTICDSLIEYGFDCQLIPTSIDYQIHILDGSTYAIIKIHSKSNTIRILGLNDKLSWKIIELCMPYNEMLYLILNKLREYPTKAPWVGHQTC